MKQFDVTAIGEVLIDFTEAGFSPDGQRLFEQNPGGAPANVVSACARLGLSTTFIGKVGEDMHGRFLRQTLRDVGVNVEGLAETNEAFTTLAFVALAGGEREFSFARKPGADTLLCSNEINAETLNKTRILHFGALSLTGEPARTATLDTVQKAKKAGALISYDPNYRGSLWPSQSAAVSMMKKPIEFVDLMKISDEETELLAGCAEPAKAAAFLLGKGVQIVAVTLGKNGVLMANTQGACTVEGYPLPAKDTTGAGDSFWAGFLCALLRGGIPPKECSPSVLAKYACFGNAAATVCVSRRGGIPAMPTLDEVERLMEDYPSPDTRFVDL